MIVVDASAFIAYLTDDSSHGPWARDVIDEADGLAAPEHCLFETANILRRLEKSSQINGAFAASAHADFLRLPIELTSYGLLASSAWRLRHNLTIYDASYVALARMLGCPLATADTRLAACPLELDVEFLIPT